MKQIDHKIICLNKKVGSVCQFILCVSEEKEEEGDDDDEDKERKKKRAIFIIIGIRTLCDRKFKNIIIQSKMSKVWPIYKTKTKTKNNNLTNIHYFESK